MIKEFENLYKTIELGIPEYSSRLDVLKNINYSHSLEINNLIEKLGLDVSKDAELIFNTNNLKILITISILDLMVNSKGIISAKNSWEEVFFTKNTFLIIHESIITCNKIKSIYKEYNNLLSDELKEIKILLKPFSKNSRIEFIRNKIGGHIHIDENFKIYFDTIQSFNINESLELINNFIIALNKIDQIVDSIMNKINIYQAEQKENILNKNKELINNLKKISSLLDDKNLIYQINNFIEMFENFNNNELS